MTNFYEQNKEVLNKTLVLSIFTICFYVFFKYLIGYIAPIIFGYFISVLIRPLSQFLSYNLKLNRSVAASISLICLLLLIGFITTTAISRLIIEAAGFYYSLPTITNYAEFVIKELNIIINTMLQIVPEAIQNGLYAIIDIVINAISNMAGDSFRNFGNAFIISAPRVAIGIVIGFISSYFFTRDNEIIRKSISNTIPIKFRKRLITIKTKLTRALWGYLKAQLIIMSLVAFIGVIGHLILGTQYALFIAVVIAIVDSVPIFGSGFFYWPWIIASLITGEHVRLMGLIAIYLLTLFTRHFLEPKILGEQIGIHPILTLASIYIGLGVFGFLGIILGPMFAVTFKTILFMND